MVDELVKIYCRDLDRLIVEIELFKDEGNLWKTVGNIRNSAGNLCLHIVGNLRTYIGRNIGHDSYIRDRDSEFSLKHVPSQELLQQVEETKTILLATLKQMPKEKLEENF